MQKRVFKSPICRQTNSRSANSQTSQLIKMFGIKLKVNIHFSVPIMTSFNVTVRVGLELQLGLRLGLGLGLAVTVMLRGVITGEKLKRMFTKVEVYNCSKCDFVQITLCVHC